MTMGKTVFTCRNDSARRLTVRKTKLAVTAIIRNMRRRMHRNPNMTYEKPEKDQETSMSRGRSHVR